MIEYIYTNEAAIRLSIFIGSFVALLFWEWSKPKRKLSQQRLQRWPNNLAMVVVSTILARLLLPMTAISVAYIVQQQHWGLVNHFEWTFEAKFIVSLLLLDLSIYFQHTLFHVIPVLWRVHRVHHADLDCDVTTGLRFHPIEILLSLVFKMATITMLGAPVLAVIVFEIVLNFMSMFTHSNIYLNKIHEKYLRYLFVTPDMHRIHHSTQENETNSNFGFNISIWDRIFGTYMAEPQDGQDGIAIGLDHFREAKWQSFWGLLRIPFETNHRGYAINYRDTKNADEISLARKVLEQSKENQRLLGELKSLNDNLESKVIIRTQELSRAKEEAEQANIAKSAFLSNMSHELRTPLNAILGYAHLLKEDDDNPLNLTQQTDIDKIISAGSHLLELINEVLDLSRLESGQVALSLEPLNPASIIEETIELIIPLAKPRDIHINYDKSADLLPYINVNQRSLREILLNLLSNAVKYNIEKGSITLRTSILHGNTLRISVTDTGKGIPTELQKGLFEPFNRMDVIDAIEGTGIGLTISKKLAELMGGTIGVTSQPNVGSTFWLDIPLSNQKQNLSDTRYAKTG